MTNLIETQTSTEMPDVMEFFYQIESYKFTLEKDLKSLLKYDNTMKTEEGKFSMSQIKNPDFYNQLRGTFDNAINALRELDDVIMDAHQMMSNVEDDVAGFH